jgi:hypothetical protein
MTFDEARYEVEVLEPARRAGDLPPADLLVRYGLAGQRLDDIAGHVARVVRHWRALRQRSRHANLAVNLLTAHGELLRDGPLDGHRLLTLVEQARAAARHRLKRDAVALAGAATCVSSATVDTLVGPPGGLIDRVTVGIVLRDAGVRVVEPLPIPDVPDKGREAARLVRSLGLQLSVEAVFGRRLAAGFTVVEGFRLGPPGHDRLTDDAIRAEIEQLERTPNDDRKAVLMGLLTILRGLVARPEALDRMVLWELAEWLRRSPAAALSHRALTEEAAAIGLNRIEAELLALSVREAGPADRLAERLGQVEDALAGGRLRAAERLAAALPAHGDAAALREQVAAAAGRVGELGADAERARAAGRTEQEAALLSEALRLAADDDDLRARLRAIPPPPATGVRAAPGTAGVTVRWQPSPALVGSITYRVARSLRRPVASVSDGVAIGDTTTGELDDPEAPPGASLYHTVFASRDGEVWSAGASAGPNVIAPDIAALRVVADGTAVSGSWRAAPGTVEVLVTRTEGAPLRDTPDGRRVDAASLTGFTDSDVRVGVTYHYLVAAVYGEDGERHVAPGVAASVTPEPAPRPITDLTATVMPGPQSLVVEVSWTAPGRGTSQLLLSQTRPSWPAGTVLPAGELRAFGREVGGAVERVRDGRRRMVLPAMAIGADSYLTAITVGRSQAAIGGTVELPMAEPVRDLSAERFGDVVRTSWRWPADSPTARVRWWQPLGGVNEVTCSRRRYDSEGLDLPVGPGPVTVSVAAVALRPSGELLASPVEVAVKGMAPRVRYAITREGWARRRWLLELVAESACELPVLVLVRRPGTVMPLRADQGEVLARVPAGGLRPTDPMVVPLEPPGSGPARLRLFAESATPAITLIDPPVRQLVLR